MNLISVPGEILLAKVLDYLIRFRETMDPEVCKKWDAIILEDYEAFRRVLARLGDKLGGD